ncbi:MAG: metal-dependent hydrolase [Gammaproteobacteria bacterium]
MDPNSQAVVGSALAQSISTRATLRAAACVGALAALLPDADVLIRSDDDPLLTLDFHRHFTHALIVSPVGALIATLLTYFFVRRRLSFVQCYLAALLGYTSAPLIDAATSYGTYLFWPFSDTRIAWNIISIIDPLFTLPLLVLCGLAFSMRRVRLARIAVAFGIAYLGFGFIQHQRAEQAARALLDSRGQQTERLTVRPSFGNLLVWRTVYEYQGRFSVAAVNIGFFQKPIWYPGGEQTAVDTEDFVAVPPDSALGQDLQRFAYFSDGYLIQHPDQPGVLGDIRYAMLPDSDLPLWGIRIDPRHPDQHAEFVTFRAAGDEVWSRFLRLLRRE